MIAFAPSVLNTRPLAYPALYRLAPSRRSLGDGYTQASQIVGTGGSLASLAVSPAISAAVFGATAPAWAVPAVGAAVVLASLAIALIRNSGCGQTCTITTDYVNKMEPALQQNLAAYLAGPRTRASQAVALGNFDQAWAWLVSSAGCGNPALGDAGKACISDRQRGANKWGGGWNWFVAYRDPIANDPQVVDSPVSSQVLASIGVNTATFTGSTWLWIGGALVLAGLVLS